MNQNERINPRSHCLSPFRLGPLARQAPRPDHLLIVLAQSHRPQPCHLLRRRFGPPLNNLWYPPDTPSCPLLIPLRRNLVVRVRRREVYSMARTATTRLRHLPPFRRLSRRKTFSLEVQMATTTQNHLPCLQQGHFRPPQVSVRPSPKQSGNRWRSSTIFTNPTISKNSVTR